MKTKKLLILLCFVTSISSYAQKRIAGRILTKTYSAVTSSENSSSTQMDTLFSFNTPGSVPAGICWDGTYIWHSDTSKYIYKINTIGVVLDSIINPDMDSKFTGGGMTYDGNNIWLVGEESAKLYQIDREGTLLNSYDLPSSKDSDPNGFGIAWDGKNLWHSQYSPSVIYKISPSDGSVISSFVPYDTFLGIEWINNKLYGINITGKNVNNSRLFEIDTITGELKDSVDWSIAYPLDLCWDNSFIWNVSGPIEFMGNQIGGKRKIYKVNTDLIPTSVSTNTYTFDEVYVYPNPFISAITIESANPGKMDIINANGQTIDTRNLYNKVETIDLGLLDPGIYLIKINDNTVKVLKRK